VSESVSKRPLTTVLGHLDELRQRLIKAVTALATATLFSFTFASVLLKLLIAPAGAVTPVFLTPTEGFLTYRHVAFLGGSLLALPVIVYQLVRFILPALKENEAKTLLIAVPGAIVSFLVGIAFAYFAMLPFASRYLVPFGSAVAEVSRAIGRHSDFDHAHVLGKCHL
jgi:sec-independent protein translocase protein TatC